MPRSLVLVLAIIAAAGSGCWTGASPSRTTPGPIEPDPSEQSGIDGASVGTGVAIGVALTVTAIVVGGVLIARSLPEPGEGPVFPGFCGSGCH